MDAFMKQAEKKEKEELRAKLQQLLDNSNMSKVKQRRLSCNHLAYLPFLRVQSEAESIDKYGVQVGPYMPEWTTTSPVCPLQCRFQHINHALQMKGR
jgi:hypothetical protein